MKNKRFRFMKGNIFRDEKFLVLRMLMAKSLLGVGITTYKHLIGLGLILYTKTYEFVNVGSAAKCSMRHP